MFNLRFLILNVSVYRIYSVGCETDWKVGMYACCTASTTKYQCTIWSHNAST